MMAQTKHSYIIRLEAENGKAVSAALREVGVTGEISMKKVSSGAVEAGSRLDGFSRVILGRLLPALGAYKAATSIFNNVQQFEKLDNRLKFLTDTTEDYARAQEFLKTKSRELNIDIFALSDGYAKLLALQKGGIIDKNQTEELLIGLANAKAALGASDVQISQSIYGLSQAMSSATVQAQEFNQVMEPLPGLMQSLDKSAGLAAGGYRELVKSGEITGAQFGKDLIKALQDFEGAAENLGGTTAAMSDLNNAWKELAQTVSKSGLNGFLAFTIDYLTDLVKKLDEATRALGGFSSSIPNAEARIKELQDRIAAGGNSVENFFNQGELEGLQKKIKGLKDIDEAQKAIKNSQENIPNYNDLLNQNIPAPAPQKPQEIIDQGFKASEESNKKAIAQAEKEAAAIRSVIEQIQIKTEALTQSDREQELSNDLRSAGVSLYSEEGQKIAALVDQYYDLKEAQDQNTEKARLFSEAIRDSAGAFDDLRSYALNTLSEIAASLVDLSTGQGSGNGLGGLIANGIFSAFTGGFGSSSTAFSANGSQMVGGNTIAYANGGVMSSGGDVPLRRYSTGGVANSPQLALYGEGSMNEAYVPLPDGRSIPVTFSGGQSQGGNTYYIDATGADQAAIARLESALRTINGTIERRALSAVQNENRRNPSYFG